MLDDEHRAEHKAIEYNSPTSSAAPLPEKMASLGSTGTSHLDDSSGASLDSELERLMALDLPALRAMWREVRGSEAAPRLGREFLRRAMAYHRQEQAFGRLSRQVQLRLKALQRRGPADDDNRDRLNETASIKAGTRFVREWQGQVHEVRRGTWQRHRQDSSGPASPFPG